MKDEITFLGGSIAFQSEKKLEEVGKEISNKLFGGVPFQGINENIYEEVPAIYIKTPMIGLEIILSGYSGFDEDKWFVLDIAPHQSAPEDCKLNIKNYKLESLFKLLLKDIKIIKLIDD